MCLFKQPKATALPTPAAPVQTRVPTEVAALPKTKEVVDADTTADVSYGTGKKKSGPAAGKKVGASALKIALNTGTEAGTTSGGLNV